MHSRFQVNQQALSTQYGPKSIKKNGTVKTVTTVLQRPYRAALLQTQIAEPGTIVDRVGHQPTWSCCVRCVSGRCAAACERWSSASLACATSCCDVLVTVVWISSYCSLIAAMICTNCRSDCGSVDTRKIVYSNGGQGIIFV